MSEAMTDAGDPGTDPATRDRTGPAGGDGGAEEPAAPTPLGVPREPTGLPAVDALLERLAEADRLPADGHLAVYEDVHGGLRAELTSLDAHPASASRPHDPRS
ncbi:hypothetical protein AB0E83_22635 [Streptomyces sp. NPDC035033]|uniref:hypothetical protein n=1 Tax=Streptomyces sp. NPDC035033 TaxID=3155368 RepID=UPI00340C0EEE